MRELPANKLDPRVKHTWRIADAVAVILLAACVVLPLIMIANWEGSRTLGTIAEVSLWVAVAVLVLVVVVLPIVRYARWRWAVTDDYLEITKGIIWRSHTMIPFIRVQNTDTRQGPLMRMWGLANVTVATAAGEHVIPGLAVADADALRDRVAELARIAREDI